MKLRIVSNSELKDFKRCKRRHWLKYVRRLRPKIRQRYGASALGTRVHDELAEYYRDHIDPATVLERFDASVKHDIEEAPDQARNIRADGDLGRAMLEGYFDWLAETGEDEHLEFIEAEREVMVPLKEFGDVALAAKRDVTFRDRRNGARRWMDHKTVGSLSDRVKTMHMDEQFKTYSLVDLILAKREGRPNDWADGGLVNMLRKVKRTARAKPPFYSREPVSWNRTVMRNMYLRIRGTVAEMLVTEEALRLGQPHHIVAYPTPTRECSYDCDFYPVCPIFDEDEGRAEEFLTDYYEEHDPYERYEEIDR